MKSSASLLRGFMLVECIIYLALVTVILGLAFGAFFQALDHSTELGRTSQATVQALQAGEQWREDIRSARGAPRLVTAAGIDELHISGGAGEIAYAFRDGILRRRSQPAAPWVDLLKEVAACRFSEDKRTQLTAWRWEIELASRRANPKFRRVLTFQAVPPISPQP